MPCVSCMCHTYYKRFRILKSIKLTFSSKTFLIPILSRSKVQKVLPARKHNASKLLNDSDVISMIRFCCRFRRVLFELAAKNGR